MAYKPKTKQTKEVQEEIIDVLTNKTKIKKGEIRIEGHKLPDPKKHQIISFIKSGIRILGYIVIPFDLPIAAGILVFSETIGIIEELV
jgi:hypothetical protein